MEVWALLGKKYTVLICPLRTHASLLGRDHGRWCKWHEQPHFLIWHHQVTEGPAYITVSAPHDNLRGKKHTHFAY
jgi:hypothetical protein